MHLCLGNSESAFLNQNNLTDLVVHSKALFSVCMEPDDLYGPLQPKPFSDSVRQELTQIPSDFEGHQKRPLVFLAAPFSVKQK